MQDNQKFTKLFARIVALYNVNAHYTVKRNGGLNSDVDYLMTNCCQCFGDVHILERYVSEVSMHIGYIDLSRNA